MDDSPVTSLQQRRAARQAVAALGATQSEAELIQAARKCVDDFPPELVLATLMAQLDGSSSQLRGGLARLATLLPHAETVRALRDYATNRSHSATARANAVLILERFLGETVPRALYADIQTNQDDAEASLREALDEARDNRIVLLEYVEQMQEYPEEVAFEVMAALDGFAPADRVGLLRLIAQDARIVVSRSALKRLDAIAASGDTTAARALHSLRFTLPPALAAEAGKSLRKLQMRGAPYAPPEASGWRALMGAVDMTGIFWLWFLGAPTQADAACFAGIRLNLNAGVIDCSALDAVPLGLLPPPAPVGEVISVELAPQHAEAFVEIAFDTGRSLLQQTLAVHWSKSPDKPLPRQYVLQNDLLWQFAAPGDDPRIDAALHAPRQAPASEAKSRAATRRLLKEPCMDGWQIPRAGDPTGARIAIMAPQARVAPVQTAHALLLGFDNAESRGELVEMWTHALQAQALWLTLAGREEAAADARALAALTAQAPPSHNPLLQEMVANGLRTEGQRQRRVPRA